MDNIDAKERERQRNAFMNIFTYTITSVVAGIVLLIIILPATLVVPAPNTGSATALRFYNTPSWIVPVTVQCLPTPVTTYNDTRLESNALFTPLNVPNERDLSNLAWAFGQLVMADVFTLALNTTAAPIAVPLVPNMSLVMQNITQLVTRCGVGITQNPWGCCEAYNDASPVFDASWLYGSTETQADALRNNVRGQLALSRGANLLLSGDGTSFVTGDSDVANENELVASLVTLFAREHNRWAAEIFVLHPAWSDDQIFYKARSYVIAEYQAIVWYEWIPAMLGGNLQNLPVPNVLPVITPGTAQVTTEFALVASQFYQTLVNVDYANVTAQRVINNGISNILRTAWLTSADRYDVHVSQTLTNNDVTKTDYITRALVRAQSVGTASYLDIRNAYHVPLAAPFSNDPATFTTALSGIYGEPIIPDDKTLSLTARTIIAEQLQRSFAYDPLFFLNADLRDYLGSTFYSSLTSATLQQLMFANTGIKPPPAGGVTSVFFRTLQ